MSAITEQKLSEILQKSRYHQFLKIRLESVSENVITLHLPFSKQFLADEAETYIHGGVIASLIDIAGDFALVAFLGRTVPTIDMRIDYLRAAGHEDLYATATVIKKGRTLGVSDVVVTNKEGRQIAIGRALYSTAEGQ